MNKEELANYIFNFWNDWGAFNHEERFDEEIKAEIWENLNSIKGINDEIQYASQEIEAGWDENSLEYKNLTTLLNHLNEYLTMFKKEEENKELYKKLCKKAIGYSNIIQDICNNDYTDKEKLQAIMSISNEYKAIFEKKEGEINE